MKERGSRVDKLYAAIHQGKTAEEAYASINRGGEGVARGTETESIVHSLLTSLPIVDYATRTTRDIRQDYQGTDMVVSLKIGQDQFPLVINHVKVQVKSSNDGIIRFRKKLMKQHKFSQEQLNEWLKKKKMIVINGRKPPQEVERDFMHQLGAINDYYQTQNNT